MTGNKINFKILQSIDGGIVTFGGIQGKIIGIGSVENQHITITNVYLVEGLNFNLLSVSKLYDNEYHIIFNSNLCHLIDSSTNKLLYQGKSDKSIYYLYLSHFKFGETCLSAIIFDSWLWHRRLGHVSMNSIKKLISLELVRGLLTKIYELEGLCDACLQDKHKRSSFKVKKIVSTNSPLELLHLDLFGPINISSISRKRFVLVIVDDYSRFIYVIFLSQKMKYLSNLSIFVIG
jgi:GAG-pre-integrase domain